MLSVRYILVEAEQHDPGGNERGDFSLRRPGVAMAQAQVEESTEQNDLRDLRDISSSNVRVDGGVVTCKSLKFLPPGLIRSIVREDSLHKVRVTSRLKRGLFNGTQSAKL